PMYILYFIRYVFLTSEIAPFIIRIDETFVQKYCELYKNCSGIQSSVQYDEVIFLSSLSKYILFRTNRYLRNNLWLYKGIKTQQEIFKEEYADFRRSYISGNEVTKSFHFSDISLRECVFDLGYCKIYKDCDLFEDFTTAEFEKNYSLDFIDPYLEDFNKVIISDEFTECLTNFVCSQQKKNLIDRLKVIHGYKRFDHSKEIAKINTTFCVEFIAALRFTKLRDFIYYFATMLLYTLDFRFCHRKAAGNTIEYIINIPERLIIPIGRNMIQLGLNEKNFGLADLYVTKKYLTENIFSKNYSFEEYINFIFNGSKGTKHNKAHRRNDFILIFRTVYLEIYIYFKNHIEFSGYPNSKEKN
ncbi:hypothetical protein H311_02992, partial [Anncaliia algerae PRA109]